MGKITTYALLGLWAAACLFPLYWVAVTSLKGEFQIVRGPFYVPFVDFAPSLDAWRFVLWDSTDNLRLQFFNSVIVGMSSTILTVAFGAFAIYGLTRFQLNLNWLFVAIVFLSAPLAVAAVLFPSTILGLSFALAAALLLLLRKRLLQRQLNLSKNVILFFLLATRILPPVVVVLPVYLMAQRTGLLDTRFALILTYTASNLPIAIWLLRPVFGDLRHGARLALRVALDLGHRIGPGRLFLVLRDDRLERDCQLLENRSPLWRARGEQDRRRRRRAHARRRACQISSSGQRLAQSAGTVS